METEQIVTWKVPSLGIDSTMNFKRDTANPTALQGVMWRYATDPINPVIAKELLETDVFKAEIPIDVIETKTAAPKKKVAAKGTKSDATFSMAASNYDPAILAMYDVGQLQQVAASVGIVNLNQPKEKLIEAIAAKMG
jgi:hypothetical protein